MATLHRSAVSYARKYLDRNGQFELLEEEREAIFTVDMLGFVQVLTAQTESNTGRRILSKATAPIRFAVVLAGVVVATPFVLGAVAVMYGKARYDERSKSRSRKQKKKQ